ncbi:AEC family transporter [Antarcticirhabdus aurantiaca]|uniref:AEC family transporter n=1 Tax=Antarcticirhabdus aurantiaca TaxID=2606717 RepID=A0ACD4NVK3_9HYPH|nr:AEC family transporter [Antarcticirhabdus aurantiaca]WAJ30930.1 AEC family transporter [Jeongeuplla avenae]
MMGVFGLIAPFFALIGLGFLASRLHPQPPAATVWLSLFVVYIALPALFVQLLMKTPVEELAHPAFVGATTLATFLMFLAGYVLRRRRGRVGTAEATIDGLASAYGNIGYMGPGLAIAAFGPGAAVPVALVFCFDNTLHFALAPLMMALSGERRESPVRLALTVLKRILGHPFIIATIVGLSLAVLRVELPEPVSRLVAILAGAAAPCALFLMGITLQSRATSRGARAGLGAIMVAKLAVHPLLAWLLLGLVGDFDPVWVKSAVLLASLPTATNVFVIAQQYGVEQERASAAVLVTTVASVASVAGVLILLTSGVLPVDPFPN